jgi:hypothetical protein
VATEVQTQSGQCPTHGDVEATRDMPGSGFPWIYHAVQRMIAKRRPFVCPECGKPVQTS